MSTGPAGITSVRAGSLRNLVTVQQRNDTQDTAGEMIPNWGTFKTVRCAVIPLQGRELETAQQIMAEVSHRIDARWTAGITPDMRILWNGRYFDIGAVMNVNELSREMQIFCTERVGSQ